MPLGSEAVHCRRSTTHCPLAVRQYIAKVALPAVPPPRGSALQELHYPLPQALRHCIVGLSLPPSNEAVYCRSCTAHYPHEVWQCMVGVALPAAPRR